MIWTQILFKFGTKTDLIVFNLLRPKVGVWTKPKELEISQVWNFQSDDKGNDKGLHFTPKYKNHNDKNF